MIGIQGAGKTTFCKTRLSDYEYVNLDTLKTRDNEEKLVKNLFREGKSFVVDNTNRFKSDRERYIPMAIAKDYKIVGYYFETCFKCKKETNVVSFASDLYYSIDDEYFELFDEDINFISDVEGVPETLLEYLKENFKFYNGYSKFAQASYLGNHCEYCGVLQGDFYLHHEPDGPFFVDSADKAKELRILRLKLPFDLQIGGSFSLCSEDYLIKKYGQFEELDINLKIE